MNYEDLMQKLDEYRDYFWDVIDKVQNFLKFGVLALILYGLILVVFVDDLETVDTFEDGVEIINDTIEDNKDEYLDICYTMGSNEWNNYTLAKKDEVWHRKDMIIVNASSSLSISIGKNKSISLDEQSRLLEYLYSEWDKINAECDKLIGFN